MGKYLLFLSTLLLLACGGKKANINYELIPVSKEKYYGYIDLTGNYVINPQFIEAGAFRDGLALVFNKNRSYGYIGTDGNYVVQPDYSDATIFNEGIAWVREDRGYPMAVDKEGNILFAAKEAYSVSIYSDGLAAFEQKEKDHTSRFGYLNRKGEVVIPAQFFEAGFFCNGLAAVANEDGKYGYINKKGELVIAYQFDEAAPFIGKCAVVSTGDYYGTIDQKGNFVVSPQFVEMSPDKDLYNISFQKSGDKGLCDNKGKVIVNPQFFAVGSFNDADLAPAWMSLKDKAGYVNKKGMFVISPQYDWASSFYGEHAFAQIGQQIGIIDQAGKYIINPQFSKIGKGFLYHDNDIMYVGSTYPYMVEARIATDYLDVNKVAEAFGQLLSDGKLDGMSFPPSVGNVLTRYSLEDKKVPVYNAWEVTTINLTEYTDVTLYLDGYFYNEVSDGWWGHKSVLNKKAKADKVSLMLSVKDVAGYASELADTFSEKFKGHIGDIKINVETYGLNAIQITLSK